MADTSIAATLGTGTLLLAASVNNGVATPIGIVAYEGNDGTPHNATPATPLPITDAAAEASLAAIAAGTPALVGGAVPISAAALPLPTNAATSALQGTANTALTAIQTSAAAIAAATPALVSGAVPVTAAALPLPTGAATAALQTTGNSALNSIEMACNSLASGVTVYSSALPTGASTSALQTSGNSSLTAIATSAAASATAANQATGNTSLAAIATSAAASATAANQATANTALAAIQTSAAASATAANQATANTALAAIQTNTTPAAAGQLPSASSRSVVTASDDPNVGPGVHVAGATVSGVNQDIIAAMDVSAYASGVFTLDNAGTSCIISYQFSNDLTSPTNWYAFGTQRLDLESQNGSATTQNAVGPSQFPLGFKWLRIRCTTYGSGSPTGSLQLNPRPISNAFTYPSTVTPVSVTNQGPANISKLLAAASTNATSIKTSAAILTELSIANQNATTTYFVKLYNKASAPTVGTDVPVAVYPIAPKSSWSPNLGPFGKRFTIGLAMAITAGYADADTTAVTSAGDVVVSWTY